MLVVLAPTVCVLWFMGEAMKNERLAVHQKLSEAYQAQLLTLRTDLEAHLTTKVRALEEDVDTRSPSSVFAALVQSPGVSSVVVYDDVGDVAYPDSPRIPLEQPAEQSDAWENARQFEFIDREPRAAADAYAEIAANATDVHAEARALQAQARCLVKAGDKQDALTIILDELTEGRFETALDQQARLVVPNAQLLALQLIADPSLTEFEQTVTELRETLLDYDDASMSGVQRRFLMQQLQEIVGDQTLFPTLEAEELAGRYIDSRAVIPTSDAALRTTPLPNVWAMASDSHRVTVLFHEATLIEELQSVARMHFEGAGVDVSVVPPDASTVEANAFVSLSAGKLLPGWRLTLHLDENALFDEQADKRIAAYLWTGTLVIVVMAGLALLIAHVFRKQMRATRLKNDLLATVSHELKTPLSSMRLLVDTLLDSDKPDPKRTREYLQLIAKENARLSRLIDNFLTFSRMERNKEKFDRVHVDARQIAATAAESVTDRFNAAGCKFDVTVDSNLPQLDADPDALITVLLNLLDNAFKYTNQDKHIVLSVFADNGHVCFGVQDNGIGLSRRAAQKVFERFYRVDDELSRSAEGSGLGLSIVRFIVNAHGGTVTVRSELGKGSTFTVRLPALTPAGANAGAPSFAQRRPGDGSQTYET